MRRSFWRQTLVSASGGILLLLGGAMANAADTGEKPTPVVTATDSPSDEARWQNEVLVSEVAARLVPDQEAVGIGYAGMVVSGKDTTIRLWWHGSVPARVSAIPNDPSDGVTVEIHQAPRTHADIVKAMYRVAAQGADADPRLADANLMVIGAGDLQDASGISVRYEPIDPTKPVPAPSSVRTILEDVAGVPVPQMSTAGPLPHYAVGR